MTLLVISMLDGTHGYRKTYHHSSTVCKWQNIQETFPKIKWGNSIQIPWLGSLILKRCFIKIKVWIQTSTLTGKYELWYISSIPRSDRYITHVQILERQNLQNKLLNITVLFIWYLLASLKKMSLAKHSELYLILASTCFSPIAILVSVWKKWFPTNKSVDIKFSAHDAIL
jgi:hypothetical protein